MKASQLIQQLEIAMISAGGDPKVQIWLDDQLLKVTDVVDALDVVVHVAIEPLVTDNNRSCSITS